VQKEADLRLILSGDPLAPQLIRKYDISYVLIGPQEQSPNLGANLTYWAQHGDLVYNDGEYRVYKVT
jgi:hypothetical protein